jgi:hypothetical protein
VKAPARRRRMPAVLPAVLPAFAASAVRSRATSPAASPDDAPGLPLVSAEPDRNLVRESACRSRAASSSGT